MPGEQEGSDRCHVNGALELCQDRMKRARWTGRLWPEMDRQQECGPVVAHPAGRATLHHLDPRPLSAEHLLAPSIQVVNLDFIGSIDRLCKVGHVGGSLG